MNELKTRAALCANKHKGSKVAYDAYIEGATEQKNMPPKDEDIVKACAFFRDYANGAFGFVTLQEAIDENYKDYDYHKQYERKIW